MAVSRKFVLWAICLLGSILLFSESSRAQICHDFAPDITDFGTWQEPVTIDISKLVPNTAVDPHPDIGVDGSEQLLHLKLKTQSFYTRYVGDYRCKEYLREGVRFLHILNAKPALEAADGGLASFDRDVLAWHIPALNSFYVQYWRGDYVLGPFKGDPLVELRRAIRPWKKLVLPGVSVSVVASRWWNPKLREPPPKKLPRDGQILDACNRCNLWDDWHRSYVTLRMTNDSEQDLYYLAGESGKFVTSPWTGEAHYEVHSSNQIRWLPLRRGQFVETEVLSSAMVFFTAKEASEQHLPVPLQHLVAFVNTEPVSWNQADIEISFPSPLRDP